jgi:hypothetical protein
MRGFQSGAFQSSGFQSAVSHADSSGGWAFPTRRKRTKEEIDEERIALGILPAPVKRIVERQAKRVIAKARKSADASPAPLDALQWLHRHQQQQKTILARELRDRQISASLKEHAVLMAYLQLEIEAAQIESQRLQDEEDEQIVRLLLEM